MGRAVRIVAPFINDFGQVIQPGEQVFAITTCTKVTRVNKAKYIGYVERNSYNWQTREYEPMKFVQISTPSTRHVYYKKGTKQPFAWSFYNSDIPGDQQYDRVEEQYEHISTLQYNRILSVNSSLDQMAETV